MKRKPDDVFHDVEMSKLLEQNKRLAEAILGLDKALELAVNQLSIDQQYHFQHGWQDVLIDSVELAEEILK